MSNQALCILLESIEAVLECADKNKAIEIIDNAIRRIDRNKTE